MATYRKDLARKPWHRPWPLRVVLIFLGLFLILIGGAAWSLETEYGGDSDRSEYVIGHDAELGGAFVYGEGGEVVYEATSIEDAEAYVHRHRGGRNYTVSIVLFGAAALSMVAGLAPSPTKRVAETTPPSGLAGGQVSAQH